jgi:SMC interacting uncharacterized protein involved in chromosome segregation
MNHWERGRPSLCFHGLCQSILERQELKPADVDKINSVRRQLERDMESVATRKQAIEQETWKLEMGLSKQLEATEALVARCNGLLQQLEVPSRSLFLHAPPPGSSVLLAGCLLI